MSKLLYLLTALVKAVERFFKRKEAREAQDERDKLEENPANWYNDHFGGVRKQQPDDSANKADANSDSKE